MRCFDDDYTFDFNHEGMPMTEAAWLYLSLAFLLTILAALIGYLSGFSNGYNLRADEIKKMADLIRMGEE